MIGEIGQLGLCMMLALSIFQAGAGFYGASKGDLRIIGSVRGAALGSFVFVALSFGALITAYVVSDFSVSAVAQNSHTAKPLLYKITGAWGNHEGSMVLWMVILGIVSAAISISGAGGPKLNARTLAVQALIATAFLIFILFTSDPFVRVYPPPFEGAGLNPLLQDPGLAVHPPLLYLGYVGLSGAFSFAAASLIGGTNDAKWIHAAKPFALAAWIALTCGIALGSWWAYYTLGWGGFWFWDPVENASLMPWLVATALIHSMMATERTGAFKSWSMLLAIAGFSFSLIGTFLVRSGVITSVHSFATDPTRGEFILIILTLAIGSALALFAWRAPRFKAGAPFEFVSRDSAILMNNLFLAACTGTVFIGTIYPLALEALTGAKISVGPPYFAVTFVPLISVLGLMAPFGPLLTWRRAKLASAAKIFRFAALAAALAFVAVLALAPHSSLGALGAGAGTWLILGSVLTLRNQAGSWRLGRTGQRAIGVALAHAGLGVVALGVAGTTVWRSEAIQVLGPGQSMQVASYTLHLEGTEDFAGPNYHAQRALVDVMSGGRVIARMQPEKRAFPVEGETISDSAIRTTIISDLYVVLGDQRGGTGHDAIWVIRAYVNPLAPFIWLGALVMAFGGANVLAARLRQSRVVARLPAASLATT